MGIKTNFDPQDFRNRYEKALSVLINGIEEAMNLAGINAVSYARDDKPKGVNDFTDRTNNLRSSIGYVLFKDGVKVGSNFVAAGTGNEGDKTNGVQIGSSYADEVASEYPEGFVMVLSAGMHYAAYVEAKGYDVITSARMKVTNELEVNFSNIIEEIKNNTNIDFKLLKK